MRQWLACLALGCFAVVGYAQESTEVTEAPKEDTSATADASGDEVAVVDSHSCAKKGCGCGGKSK